MLREFGIDKALFESTTSTERICACTFAAVSEDKLLRERYGTKPMPISMWYSEPLRSYVIVRSLQSFGECLADDLGAALPKTPD